MEQFKWKETNLPERNESKQDVTTIRIVDTKNGERIELYNQKGLIVDGKKVENEKEKTQYLSFIQTRYPKATLEKMSFYDLVVDDCPSEHIELYSFFPAQLETIIEKNFYDMYDTHVPVGILLHMTEDCYPVEFYIREEEMEDVTIVKQIQQDYWREEKRYDEIFEAVIQDITGKKIHKIEIDQTYGFQPSINDWTNEGNLANGYEAKLNIYVK